MKNKEKKEINATAILNHAFDCLKLYDECICRILSCKSDDEFEIEVLPMFSQIHKNRNKMKELVTKEFGS